MGSFKTEQERFWAGEFGDQYIDRNNPCTFPDEFYTPRVALWARMLRSAKDVSSIIEFGCNVGLNLSALRKLNSNLQLHGIEINEKAAKIASEIKGVNIVRASILDDMDFESYDLAFTSGVLIHINPDYLDIVYSNLYKKSKKYVLVAEYYNPNPVTVNYRGHTERLFKRDFAGDLMDKFGMKLIDYGFVYRRDNWVPQDDVNWFLLQK